MQNRSFTVDEARNKLEYYCSYQERCHQEVERKLSEMGMIKASKELIIIHLIENDFLNEERFAKTFVRGKFRIKKWGKQRIIKELKLRSISDYNIKSGLKEINESEYYNAFDELSKKRFNEIKVSNKYKKRKKLADYLLYRGWESNLVYEKTIELIP